MIFIVEGWPRSVGPAVARAAWPLRISRDGTLHVACASSTWAFELGRMAPELAGALQRELGLDHVPELRFALGPVPASDLDPAPAPIAPVPGEPERSMATAIAADVSDDELRAMIERAIAAALARHRDGRDV